MIIEHEENEKIKTHDGLLSVKKKECSSSQMKLMGHL